MRIKIDFDNDIKIPDCDIRVDVTRKNKILDSFYVNKNMKIDYLERISNEIWVQGSVNNAMEERIKKIMAKIKKSPEGD